MVMEYRPPFSEKDLTKTNLQDLIQENNQEIENFEDYYAQSKVLENEEVLERVLNMEAMMKAILQENHQNQSQKVKINKQAYMLLGSLLIVFSFFQMVQSYFPEVKEQIIFKEIPAKKPLQYVTTKFVNLRVEPKTNARKIITIPPNVHLNYKKKFGNWVELEFFNYSKNRQTRGWAYLENLKKLK